MKTTLTQLEKQVLLEFLSELSHHQNISGCNDYDFPNDAQHQALMKRVITNYHPYDDRQRKAELDDLQNSKDRINTTDSAVLHYLRDCVKHLNTEEVQE